MKAKYLQRVALIAVFAAPSAFAVSITPGNVPGDTSNVLYNIPGLLDNGTTVQGTFNGPESGFLVNFTSTSQLSTPSSGQARVAGPFSDLAIELANGATFDYAILNPQTVNNASGTINFSVNGSPVASFAIGNGQNFFTIDAGPGELISQLSFTTSVPLEDVRQVRIGGMAAQEVPDAGSTLALAGLGMLVVAGLRSKIRR